ncbi:MAG: hypothetical protein QG604_547 [Candidatus Dependentiae bacterium]|nr:hypothetical protein [Candidatus Dependentiae bacterium]
MLFSYTLWLTPLWSSLAGFGLVGVVLWAVFKYCVTGSNSFLLHNTGGLPTIAAVAAWRYSSLYPRLFLAVLPVLSTITFISHVGLTSDAWFSVYWMLMPLLLLLSPAARAHVITRSIIASLTAHMTGALIVCLFGASVKWSLLVPLVPFERLVSIVGMLVVSMVLNRLHTWARRRIALQTISQC